MAKARLETLIREYSFRRGEFTLASGETSDHFFDLKPTLLNPEGASLVAELLLDALPEEAEAIGGLELGACPLVSSMCVVSHTRQRPLTCFYVRKAQKERGTRQRIEGATLTKGQKVVILDDVTTKGGSSLKAVEAAQEAGGEVIAVMSVLDRQQGAAELFGKHDIPLISLFTKDIFLQN